MPPRGELAGRRDEAALDGDWLQSGFTLHPLGGEGKVALVQIEEDDAAARREEPGDGHRMTASSCSQIDVYTARLRIEGFECLAHQNRHVTTRIDPIERVNKTVLRVDFG